MHALSERGVIRNVAFATQVRNYAGLRWGAITPTDIDGFVEFNDQLFVFIESKFGTTPLAGGQRLALERLAHAIEASGRACIVLGCEHQVPCGAVIHADDLVVREYRWRGAWRTPRTPIKAADAIAVCREKYLAPL